MNMYAYMAFFKSNYSNLVHFYNLYMTFGTVLDTRYMS